MTEILSPQRFVTAPPVTAQLSVVVPTYNEAGNVPKVIDALTRALAGIEWEVIFVDDNSPDDTAATVRKAAERNGRVRLVHRIGRRGLSSACVEGMLASTAPYIAVMDGDLQHDEELLPRMLDVLKAGQHDIVIGSRYVDGGTTGEWAEERARISNTGTRLAQNVIHMDVKDPLSGYFMMTREAFLPLVPKLSAMGYKILFDLFASANGALRAKELPMTFRTRAEGESKLDSLIMWEFLMLLADKSVGHIIPARLISFALVGGTGVIVNLVTMALFFQLVGTSFPLAQATGFLASLTSNFLLNNMLTYSDRRLTGWGLVMGWFTFAIACSIGGIANVGVANWIYLDSNPWILASIAGIAVGTVWNFFASSILTWRVRTG